MIQLSAAFFLFLALGWLHNSSIFADPLDSKQSARLLVMISITSGPAHAHYRNAARNSWLLPCIQSPLCDYRFFVDISETRLRNETSTLHESVIMESLSHKDMVFRDSCALLMNRHPESINYGNSPPVQDNLKHKLRDNSDEEVPVPDYPLRRVYKIDWKVCFLQWINRTYEEGVDFHVFVEDDSFTCTLNLLHQLSLVRARWPSPAYHFRAGTPMFDGYDDSSTIMDGGLVKPFVDNYPSSSLVCHAIEDDPDALTENKFVWMSWGNSWRSQHCNWKAQLSRNFNVNYTTPRIDCIKGLFDNNTNTIQLPCMRRPVILHHSAASHVLLHEEKGSRPNHLCEYMLLIDKIKEPDVMHKLYNITADNHYFHDFSDVFLTSSADGWQKTLVKLRQEELACEVAHNNVSVTPTVDCLFGAGRRRNLVGRLRGSERMTTFRDYFGNS